MIFVISPLQRRALKYKAFTQLAQDPPVGKWWTGGFSPDPSHSTIQKDKEKDKGKGAEDWIAGQALNPSPLSAQVLAS